MHQPRKPLNRTATALLIAVSAVIIGAVVGTAGLGRAAALGIAAVMIGAVVTAHAANGFFMNWSGTQAGEGFEFHILALAMAVAVMIRGSGALSIDRMIGNRFAN